MWWKFWTWFRSDSAHEGGSRTRNARPVVRATMDASGRPQSEDILSSISTLIDAEQNERVERTDKPANRTYEAIQLGDAKTPVSKEATGLETWANDDAGDTKSVYGEPTTSKVADLDSNPDDKPEQKTEEKPSKLGETVRPSELDHSTNRRPEQSDRPASPMKTLTAENGEWPGFDSASEGFGDFDDDDDESDGTSPYQTIVPRDH